MMHGQPSIKIYNGTVIHYILFCMAAVKTTCFEVISMEEK